MKIAFVYDVPYPWHKGGIEQMLATEAEILAKEHEVHFFTLRWPGMKKSFVQNGVTYHTFGNANETNVYRHGRRSIREAFVFSVYCTSLFGYKFDAIITDEFPVLHLLPVRLYRAITGCKLVMRVAEIWDRKYWINYLGPTLGSIAAFYSRVLLLSGSANYITLSGETSEQLIRMGVPKSRTRPFSPVLDNSKIMKIGKRKRGERVMFTGRFIKEKRVDKWLSAFKKVSNTNKSARGLIIGDGVEKENILSTIKKMDLGSRVEVKNFYQDKLQVYRDIASSSVFLHMSEREGLSIVALESLALGTPVVLPDYSPIPNDVKSMCIVASEEKIPRIINEILESKDKSQFIKNKQNLAIFSMDGIKDFYKKILS